MTGQNLLVSNVNPVMIVSTSLSLVAGLAWNEAIQSAIETYYPLRKSELHLKFLYAIIVTAVAVISAVLLLYFIRTAPRVIQVVKADIASDAKKIPV